MGVFDFFRRRSSPPPTGDDGPPVDKKLAAAAKTACDKRAQGYDREQAIRQLGAMGTPEASAALLKRFTFTIDPSITDQDERALAYDGIVSAGRGGPTAESLSAADLDAVRGRVVSAVTDFCAKAENLNWPLRLLRALLSDDEYESELLRLLAVLDIEYTRNVEPKVNLISALEEIHSQRVREAVLPFLEDVNETVRFHTVETLFRQGDAEVLGPLAALVGREESVRIKNKVAEGFLRLGWQIPEAERPAVASALAASRDFRMGPDGTLRRL